jgi:hypothetical protein
MNDDTMPGFAGVADEDHATLNPAQNDAPAPVALRAPDGRFLPGRSGNPRGRPLGSQNSTTAEANNILRARAARAAELLSAKLDDASTPWIQLNAAVEILKRTGVGTEQAEAFDPRFISCMSEREINTIDNIVTRAKKRFAERNHILDVEVSERNEKIIASLEAPPEIEREETRVDPEDVLQPDEEEFG